jgi:hypothetical protein
MADLVVVPAKMAGAGHIGDYAGGNVPGETRPPAKIASSRYDPFRPAA